ncbi:MAG: hypothetical protein WC709_06315 [Thermoleophilia bacterium]
MQTEPRHLAEQVEAVASLPAGAEERFSGYGVMGLPMRSGHVLALRRYPASSVGPGYTSVWHRTPDGDWTLYANVSARRSCARFFGAIASDAIETEIRVAWLGPSRLRVVMPAVPFEWEMVVGATAATRFMNAAGRLLPKTAWQRPAVLAAMGLMAGPLLGVGHVGLQGTVPNGQHFIANPRLMWTIVDSRARLAGEDLGRPGPVHPQARLGDFWIPQRGILAIGQTYFAPFDPARHSAQTCRSPAKDSSPATGSPPAARPTPDP